MYAYMQYTRAIWAYAFCNMRHLYSGKATICVRSLCIWLASDLFRAPSTWFFFIHWPFYNEICLSSPPMYLMKFNEGSTLMVEPVDFKFWNFDLVLISSDWLLHFLESFRNIGFTSIINQFTHFDVSQFWTVNDWTFWCRILPGLQSQQLQSCAQAPKSLGSRSSCANSKSSGSGTKRKTQPRFTDQNHQVVK